MYSFAVYQHRTTHAFRVVAGKHAKPADVSIYHVRIYQGADRQAAIDTAYAAERRADVREQIARFGLSAGVARNLAPKPDDTQRAAQVARRIEFALANGVPLDAGNVIDYLADSMTRASLSELRVALSRTIYASRFPKACAPL